MYNLYGTYIHFHEKKAHQFLSHSFLKNFGNISVKTTQNRDNLLIILVTYYYLGKTVIFTKFCQKNRVKEFP